MFERLRAAQGSVKLARMSWKILITARTLNEVGATALKILRNANCEVIMPAKFGPHRPEALLPLLDGADATLASMDQYNADVLNSPAARNLKIISRWGVGFDAIDVPTATRLG